MNTLFFCKQRGSETNLNNLKEDLLLYIEMILRFQVLPHVYRIINALLPLTIAKISNSLLFFCHFSNYNVAIQIPQAKPSQKSLYIFHSAGTRLIKHHCVSHFHFTDAFIREN